MYIQLYISVWEGNFQYLTTPCKSLRYFASCQIGNTKIIQIYNESFFFFVTM